MMMPTVSKGGEQEHAKTVLDNRVPEISIAFWVIKILSTTTGETVSDYLNETVGLGLPNTTYITMSLLIVTMVAQFYSPRYNPYIYWLAVILYSIVGTAITDNLTDGLEVELWLSTVVFAVLLAVTFGVWYYKEKTLNFHTIFTRRREAFYWVAILFTFALGTAGGDLITEGWGWGYGVGVALFGGLIVAITAAWYFAKANGVTCFWLAYILTRPLGASIGDLFSQDKSDGGLGLGTTAISIVFLVIIMILTVYLDMRIRKERRAALETTEQEAKGATGVDLEAPSE
jgi:uncharacterized membrane-anchored protein